MGTFIAEPVLTVVAAVLQDAPYLLEPVVGTFDAEEVPVRLALLSAAAKLFFKRPPECQKLLGKAPGGCSCRQQPGCARPSPPVLQVGLASALQTYQ